MNRVPLRALIAAAALGLLALLVAACGSSDKAPAGSKEMAFTLTDAGCEPHNANAAAGPIDFEVENGGTGSVTELEVLDGETILGERENITEGLKGNFSLTLEEGEYTLRCNGGTEEDGTLKVTGKVDAKTSPETEKAIADYREYLVENADELTAKTKPFVAAVEAGDIAKAKLLYPEPRINYERIEPVAESFGDLDPRIDARENDVKPSEFGGFHRLEKALWEEESLKGMKPVAEALQADVEELEEKVHNVSLQAVQIANGANELLTEVSTSKITGEEERYSHIDLVDFKANVEGSQVAFEAVAPLMEKKDPKPAKEIEKDFEAVYAALKPYETSKWPGFVLYGELNKADTRKLAQVIDTLAENLSLVPAQIAKGEGLDVTPPGEPLAWKVVNEGGQMSFGQAPGERADQLLAELGYADWRPGQREAVIAALEGRDSLIVMPTGGGKSLCYQLPGLASDDLTIVVSPLIALMRDQWLRLTQAGHPVAMVSSGMSDEDAAAALESVRNGRTKIVYCAPERFASGLFLDAIGQRRIDLLAVDEAHCVSEWGHDFRPDYLRLPQIAERLGRPTVMACTATATVPVAVEIAQRFEMREPLRVRAGFDRPNISFDVIALEGTGSKARRQALLETGLADPANRPAIVYCGTRKDTDEVAEELRGTGLRALAYHAGMEGEERWRTQRRFMSGGEDAVDVVVATNAFGMGVDKADVRSVWHMAIPTSVEAYYQEAGRAGRDGLPARAVMLAMKSDLGRLVRFNEQRANDPELAIAHERGWRAYRAIKDFIYGTRCGARLLAHFGDRRAETEPLGRCCDICDMLDWLPDPDTIAVRRPLRSSASSAPAPDLPTDAPLFEALKKWRLQAAEGKPAYTVASNKTLATIAARRPSGRAALIEINGVGPAFVTKFADEVLTLVAEHESPLAA